MRSTPCAICFESIFPTVYGWSHISKYPYSHTATPNKPVSLIKRILNKFKRHPKPPKTNEWDEYIHNLREQGRL